MLCNQFQVTRSVCQQLWKFEWCCSFTPQFQKCTPYWKEATYLNAHIHLSLIYFAHPAEKMSISGRRLAVLFCSFDCSPSIIDAESRELPPMSKPLFELFASAENDFTNLQWNGVWWNGMYNVLWINRNTKLTVRVPHSMFCVGLYRRNTYNQLDYLLANTSVWTMQNRTAESNSTMWLIYFPAEIPIVSWRVIAFKMSWM